MSLNLDLHFFERPNEFVFRLQGQTIYAERKGCWTWIKTHLLFWNWNQYRLETVLEAIKQANPAFSNENQKDQFYLRINGDIKKFNEKKTLFTRKPIDDQLVQFFSKFSKINESSVAIKCPDDFKPFFALAPQEFVNKGFNSSLYTAEEKERFLRLRVIYIKMMRANL